MCVGWEVVTETTAAAWVPLSHTKDLLWLRVGGLGSAIILWLSNLPRVALPPVKLRKLSLYFGC